MMMTPQRNVNRIAPRTVTPSNALTASSWEDFDQGVFGTPHRMQLQNKHNPSFSSHVVAEEDEEMPMDERMDTRSRTNTSTVTVSSNKSTASAGSVSDDGLPPEHASTGLNRIIATLKQPSSTNRPSNLTPEERVLWDAIQNAMQGAIQSKQNILERQLSTRYAARETDLEFQVSELKTKVAEQTHTFDDRGSGVAKFRERVQELEQQLRKTKAALKKNHQEHESEVLAIQRVLADVTTQSEQETQVLEKKVSELTKKVKALEGQQKGGTGGPQLLKARALPKTEGEPVSDDVSELTKALEEAQNEAAAAKRETDTKTRRLIVFERDHKVAKAQLHKAEDERKRLKSEVEPLRKQVENLNKEISDLKMRLFKLDEEADRKENQIQNLKRNTSLSSIGSSTPPRHDTTDNESVASSVEVENLQSSLENAKKIIASLENANGSLALDLRGKLKAKEEELQAVEKESAERKRRLDSLATELRDLQRKQGDAERAEASTKAQVVRQKALMIQLDKGLSGLQSASVVHEVTTATGQPDPANVDQISEILTHALLALRSTVEMTENYVDEFDDQSIALTDVDCPSEVGRHIDSLIRHDREAAAKDLRHELDQKKNAVRRLEDALKKQNEEMKRLRSELGERKKGDDESNENLRAEIQSLREQCSTNMEVLAKKERELSVLRSSLKVDENDAGYISDDASDADDDDDETDTVMSPAQLNGYGPAETEALATILAHSGTRGVDLTGRSQEVESLRIELMKALGEKEKAAKDIQTERESLANAKMIISSLEKANKSMMEDLRSRLHDSNTAIASLLDKSMDHEKTSNTLKEEVEKLKLEKEELEKKHQADVKKLKDDTKVHSLLIAAKDRELSNLRKGTSQAEEKKEDEGESIEVTN